MSNVLRLGDRVRVRRSWSGPNVPSYVEGTVIAFPNGAQVQVRTKGSALVTAEFRDVSRVDGDVPDLWSGGDAA